LNEQREDFNPTRPTCINAFACGRFARNRDLDVGACLRTKFHDAWIWCFRRVLDRGNFPGSDCPHFRNRKDGSEHILYVSDWIDWHSRVGDLRRCENSHRGTTAQSSTLLSFFTNYADKKNVPELPIGRFLKLKLLGGNRVILVVSQVEITRRKMMDSFLTLLAVAAAAVGFTLGLLWIVRRFFGVLPDTFNSAKINDRLRWFLLAIVVLAFWLSSFGEILAGQEWSLSSLKNLIWLVVLPSFFSGIVQCVISGETFNVKTFWSFPVGVSKLDSETEADSQTPPVGSRRI
jgi:hypothetical protein